MLAVTRYWELFAMLDNQIRVSEIKLYKKKKWKSFKFILE